MPIRWTPERMNRLEHAIRKGLRVALMRRGTEYIVTAVRLASQNNKEAFVGHLPMTGDELTFVLEELDDFQVIGD
jgi:hypothetical protein